MCCVLCLIFVSVDGGGARVLWVFVCSSCVDALCVFVCDHEVGCNWVFVCDFEYTEAGSRCGRCCVRFHHITKTGFRRWRWRWQWGARAGEGQEGGWEKGGDRWRVCACEYG